MAQAGSVSMGMFKNYHQGTQVIPPVDERHKQREQQHQQRDKRFHIPDDEHAFQVDEYV